MGTTRPSHFVTWFFIGSTLLPPALLVAWAGFSGVLISPSETGLIAVALAACGVVGVLLGFLISPRSPYAGLGVFASPLITTVAWFLIAGGYDVCFRHTPVSRVIHTLCVMSIGILLLSIPTAGIVRATHWLRDRQS